MQRTVVVEIEEDKLNIKLYIERQLGYSSRKAKELIKQKKVRINNKVAYWDNEVRNGDVLLIEEAELEMNYAPQEMELDILYEDAYFLAVNKPPYMLVHPTPNHPEGTLANGLSHYFLGKGLNGPVRFLSRLDMNTSGVILIPLSDKVHTALSEGMQSIRKVYAAVVEGNVEPSEGRIEKPIGKDPEDPIRRKVIEGGQEAVTLYKVTEKLRNAVLVELELLTGRTHQIRVHMQSIGNPVIGDSLYGNKTELIGRQALHAYRVDLVHPYTGERIVIEAPIPEDIRQLINKLR